MLIERKRVGSDLFRHFRRIGLVLSTMLALTAIAEEPGFIGMLRNAGLNVTRTNQGDYYVATPRGQVQLNNPNVSCQWDSQNGGTLYVSVRKNGGEFTTYEQIPVPIANAAAFNQPYNLSPVVSSACMQGLCWDFSQLSQEPSSQKQYLDSNFVTSDNLLLNAAIQNSRQARVSAEAIQFLQDFQTAARLIKEQARSDEDIRKQNASRMQELLSGLMANPISSQPEESQPTPYPPSVAPEQIDRAMKPLRDASAKASPIDGAEAVRQLTQRVKMLRENPGIPGAAAEADYIDRELHRLYLDRQGLLKNLAFAHTPAQPFRTSSASKEGARIRDNLNALLAVEEVAKFACAGLGENQACSSIQDATDDLKAAHLAADRLAFSGKTAAFEGAMTDLETTVKASTDYIRDFSAGFGSGVGSGALGMVKGLATMLTSPVETARGIYTAVTNYEKTWSLIKVAAAEKYETLVNGSPEEAGKIVGELTFEVASSLVPVGPALKVAKAGAFRAAVGMAVTRGAMEKLTAVAELSGKISASFAAPFNSLTKSWPLAAREMVRAEGTIENLATKTPGLTERSVQGLEKVDTLVPGSVAPALIEAPGEALTLGEGAAGKLQVEITTAGPRAPPAVYEKPLPALPEAGYLIALANKIKIGLEGKNAVFWSGGDGAREAAEAFMLKNPESWTTLEGTAAGRYFDDLKLFDQVDAGRFSLDDAKTIWKSLSRRYAEEASGTARIFVNSKGLTKAESILNSIELPALERNPNITGIFGTYLH